MGPGNGPQPGGPPGSGPSGPPGGMQPQGPRMMMRPSQQMQVAVGSNHFNIKVLNAK